MEIIRSGTQKMFDLLLSQRLLFTKRNRRKRFFIHSFESNIINRNLYFGNAPLAPCISLPYISAILPIKRLFDNLLMA